MARAELMFLQQQHQSLDSGQHQRAVGQKRDHDVRTDTPRKGCGLWTRSRLDPDGGQRAGQGDQTQVPGRLEYGPSQHQRVDQQGGQRHGIEKREYEASPRPDRVKQDPGMQQAACRPGCGRGGTA